MRRLLLGMVLVVGLGACHHPCDAEGAVCTWAGTGEAAFNGDGKDRLESSLYWPVDLSFGPDGDAYLLDWNNHRVRRVSGGKTLSTIIGNDNIGDGPNDNSDLTETGAPGLEVNLNHPTQIVFLPDGTGLLAAWHNHKLRHWNPETGRVRVTCGAGPGFSGDGASAHGALLNQPKSLAVAKNGDVYLVDQRNQRIRRIRAADGVIETVVGNGIKGFGGDNGPPLAAQLSFPTGGNPLPGGALALDEQGRLYIADTENDRVRRVDFEAKRIETIVGTGEAGYSGDDGPALQAKLNHPRDLALDGDVLFIADTENHSVRKLELSTGVISAVAGNGAAGDSGDFSAARAATLNRPMGVAVDAQGNLFVADTYNHRVRRIARGASR